MPGPCRCLGVALRQVKPAAGQRLARTAELNPPASVAAQVPHGAATKRPAASRPLACRRAPLANVASKPLDSRLATRDPSGVSF